MEDSQNFESDNPDSESVLYANRFHDVGMFVLLEHSFNVVIE